MRKLIILISIGLICLTTIQSQAHKLAIDSTQCYIIDSFLNTDWANTTLTPSYGNNSYFSSTWFGSSSITTKPAYKNGAKALLIGAPLNYTVKNIRSGNYNNSMGILNLKNLYRSDVNQAFQESHVQSYLQLPQLPGVGRIIVFFEKAYSTVTDSCMVESLVGGIWKEVAHFAYPLQDSYIYLDTIAGNKIQSATPVTYRFRSSSYNPSTSSGFGPVMSELLVQSYKTGGNAPITAAHPYYPMTESSTAVSTATNIVNQFTEAQWMDIVPTQAPRSMQVSPQNALDNTWNWDPTTPNQITCVESGITFPNVAYPPLYASTKVMTGKTVQVPYHVIGGVTTYVQAQIDYQKVAYLRSALPTLATAYQRSGNEVFARYVALALDKWANAVPDFFMTQAWNKSTLVGLDQLPTYKSTSAFVQRASDHNGLTHEFHDEEVYSMDRIWDSQAIKDLTTQKGYNVRNHIMNDFLLNIALWLRDQPTMESHCATNLVSHIGTMIRVAGMAENELTKESLINFADSFFTLVLGRNIKRDGMYPESFSYHKGYVEANNESVSRLDDYFQLFPPTTTAMQNIYASCQPRIAFTKRTCATHKLVGFPDGDMAPFDDTTSGGSDARSSTTSHLLPAYQHGMLGDGVLNSQTQVNIGANDKANHVGNSALTMTLFANGKEQLGDIRYSRIPGRDYTNSVQGHNLVAIDENDAQYYTSARQVYGNDGHVFTNGYFSMYEPNLDGISVMEVYSKTINPGKVTRYQRLHILNTIELARPYLIDVFVTQGGSKHDYILQGSTQVDQDWTTSLPAKVLTPVSPLLPAGETYTPPLVMDDSRNWYGVYQQMSEAVPNSNWNVTFKETAGSTGVKIWSVNNQPSDVFIGKSPVSYRRTTADSLFGYLRPMFVERRAVSKSVYIHIMEPFGSGSGQISSVDKLPMTSSSDEFITLQIMFTDGRKDIVLINLNDKLITGIAPTQTLQTSDNVYSLTGKIGLIYKGVGKPAKGYLINGSQLKNSSAIMTITNPVVEGTVQSVTRKETGAADNAILTTTAVSTTDVTSNRWVRLTYGTYNVINPPTGAVKTQTEMNELFEITSIEKRTDGKTYFICKDDPYLSVSSTSATELMRPQRAFTGATAFMLIKSKVQTLDITSVSENKIQIPDFQIYPNPAKDGFVNISSDQPISEVTLTNLSGITVFSQKILPITKFSFPVSNISSGIYLLQIKTEGGGMKWQKLLINQ